MNREVIVGGAIWTFGRAPPTLRGLVFRIHNRESGANHNHDLATVAVHAPHGTAGRLRKAI